MPWIVDGNNLGGAIDGARGARDRAAVWRRVFAWAGGRRRVVVVFDGAPEPDIPERLGSVEVRWAVGIAADEVVRRVVSRRPRDWRVVTDDRRLQEVCRDLGAKVVSARDWVGREQGESSDVAADKVDGTVDVDDWLQWFERQR